MKRLLLGLLLVACAPGLAPYDPARSLASPWLPPDRVFWLGTDALGRDLLSRLLHGGGALLLFSCTGTLLACCIGLLGGLLLVALPQRGRYLVSLLDSMLIVPPLVVMMVLCYVIGSGSATLLWGIVLLNAPFTARYVRSLADPLLDSRYVEVARAAGDSLPRVLWREVLPGLYPALCADAGTRLVGAIYLFSAISFLGIAVPAQGADWAGMVRDGLVGLALNPWAALLPASCIAAVVLLVNLTADGRRQT